MTETESALLPTPTQPMNVARAIVAAWVRSGIHIRHWRGSWMYWRTSHWVEIPPDEMRTRLYTETETATYEALQKEATVVRPWAPNRRKIGDLTEALAAATHLSAAVEDRTWLSGEGVPAGPVMSCRNGLLHVNSRALYPHSVNYFNVSAVALDYQPDSPAPAAWLEFLHTLWPQDPQQVAALQEWFGYVLSGRTDLHKMCLLVGPPRAGKGTITRVLTELVGGANVVSPTFGSLASNFGSAALIGKSLAIVADARLSGKDSVPVVEKLLSISGEDQQSIDRKHLSHWQGTLPTRFLVASNELPRLADSSGAIVTRWVSLLLTQSFLGREDAGLQQRLLNELPGILLWGLDGLDRLNRQGKFTSPKTSLDAVQAMADDASPISAFLRERVEQGSDKSIPIDDLFAAWQRWCLKTGRDQAGPKNLLGRNLRSVLPGLKEFRPPIDPKTGKRPGRSYRALALRPDDWEDEDADDPAEEMAALIPFQRPG